MTRRTFHVPFGAFVVGDELDIPAEPGRVWRVVRAGPLEPSGYHQITVDSRRSYVADEAVAYQRVMAEMPDERFQAACFGEMP